MSLFDKLFGRAPQPKGDYKGYFRLLNGYEPHFSKFGGNIYESELVRASINAIATHCGKLDVTIQGSAKPALKRKLQHAPNEFQTWEQFMRRLATILYVHNTAFLVPVYDRYGEPSGMYAVLPDRCEVVEYGAKKVPYLRYHFGWGETAAIELEYCGIMTRFQYRSDLFGESNAALLPTMDLIKMTNQGIEEGTKNAAQYRFLAQLSNFAKPEDLKMERQRFNEENFSKDAKGGGLLLVPNTYSNVTQLKNSPFVITAEQMKIINDSVYNYFGVNDDVLQSKFSGDGWSSFYESVVEPFAIQFSQVATRMVYTFREQSEGNMIMATSNRLQYMSNSDKLAVSAQMADRGLMTRNEIREIWNLPPLPEGIGDQLPVRGEYYNIGDENNADTENDTE